MSLEDLKAQAEAEEEVTTEAEEPEAQGEPEPDELEAEEADSEQEGSSDEEEGNDAEEAEPSEDFELELDGEPEPGQQKPSPEEALVYKLTKQKQKTREYKDELEELREELKALKEGRQPQAPSRPQQPAHQYPPVPLLYENGIDTPEQYQKAYQKWVADCKAIDQRNAEADQQKTEYKRRMEEMTHNLAKRLGKFATEYKVKDTRVISAAERATSEIDAATKIEGSLAYLLDSVGDGGERVAYHIGTNDKALARVKELLAQDSTGLKAIAEMTRMAERLKPKHSVKTSQAPAPDTPLKGDGSPASQKRLQDEYDKASEKGDLKAMRAALNKAEQLGVRLK